MSVEVHKSLADQIEREVTFEFNVPADVEIPRIDNPIAPCDCGQCQEFWDLSMEARESVFYLWFMENFDR